MSLFQKVVMTILPSYFQKVVRTILTSCYYDYLVPTTLEPGGTLFQEVVITNMLCLCSAPVTPPILPSKSSICKPPPYPSYKNLVFLISNVDLSNLPQGRQQQYRNNLKNKQTKKDCFYSSGHNELGLWSFSSHLWDYCTRHRQGYRKISHLCP